MLTPHVLPYQLPWWLTVALALITYLVSAVVLVAELRPLGGPAE